MNKMILYLPAAVILGFLLDLLIGDPVWLYHPVRMIGNLITISEKMLRRILPKTKSGERLAGGILVIVVTGISTAVPILILYLCYRVSPVLFFAAEVFFSYQILATKSLKTESMKVYHELCRKDLAGARTAVSMIVGRDTAQLSEEGVTKATVETIAENSSDGIIAPLLFLMAGGPVLGFFYKAVNTMDSMVGYKNEKYKYFGTAAAKFDDLLNYLPSRISGILMAGSAGLAGLNTREAFRIFFRDRGNHSSPNSAQTEAAMAGALNVQLAGNAVYFGKLYEKPTIGDQGRAIEPEDIRRANRLLYATAFVSLAVFAAVSFGIRWALTMKG